MRSLARLPRDFTFRGATPPEAAWLAAALFEAWPPRRRPQEVVLHRRPDVTDERWQALWHKLALAAIALGELGVPVSVAHSEAELRAWVTGQEPQGTLFEGVAA